MEIEFDCGFELDQIIRNAAKKLEAFGEGFDPQIRQADERFGDFQANGVLPHAKAKRQNPRDLAQNLIDSLPKSDFWETSIAGPGFINFKLTPLYFYKWIEKYKNSDSIASSARVKNPKKIVVDFSSPNTAKQMHVGHIRSTIIGECIARLLEFQGNEIIRDNHLGDWGTQFGILLYAIKRQNISLEDLGEDPIAELENLYRQGNSWIKENEVALNEAREELVKLQSGDPENLLLWEKIREISMNSFHLIYKLLGIEFDYSLGESFYRNKVDPIYEKLLQNKICQEDKGALVVFHPEHKRFAKQPFIIRKSDGASNYATTDLATVQYRTKEWQADEIIYVTDGRQRDHFEQLFLTVKKWFNAEKTKIPTLTHVWFGTILGDDNKAIKTRDGQPIKLIDLLNEAIQRARKLVIDKKPDLETEQVEERAKSIGLGAVRYADLSQDRTLDYVFSWDKLLAMQGNTAPYLQYAVARIHSIFRKAKTEPAKIKKTAYYPSTEPERKLARKLVFFPSVLKQTTKELKPHILGGYLYELATEFSSFYNQNKIMVEEKDIMSMRLLLCSQTLNYLKIGSSILGIKTIKEM